MFSADFICYIISYPRFIATKNNPPPPKKKKKKINIKMEKLFSDHFIKGTLQFFTLISLIFTSMLSHSIASPTGLLLSLIVPVPKDKRGSKSDSNNYIAIAISCIMGKLFDSIIIKDQHLSLVTDDLQFGFKKILSTSICTLLLIETIEYYNINNTDCCILLLNASKAFDRIGYVRYLSYYAKAIHVQLFCD